MSLRLRIRQGLTKLLRLTADPPPDQRATIRHLNNALVELSTRDDDGKRKYLASICELAEARQMAGCGPWLASPATLQSTDRLLSHAVERYQNPVYGPVALREANDSIATQGLYGDIELALQNVQWRREVSLSQLEFSRWGIQQIILICRLHYVKNPWIRRGINLSAAYVFGQGVELSSPDPDANEALKRFRDRNKVSLGQIALTDQERRKSYDGNLFWVLFSDPNDSGDVDVRTIDATEIQEIVTDPEDAETPQYYRRVWTSKVFDLESGQSKAVASQRWYPALGYEPAIKPAVIGKVGVDWEHPVYHRRTGAVANWTYGLPRAYAAIDWAKEGRRHLESCASVTQALSQIAMTYTTKGGQQAIEGFKSQMSSSVGPSSSVWDQTPPGVAGSTFASGPGSKLEAFKVRGMGADPGDVKEYRNMAACVLEIPPTWLGDMETSNLSTAQTLDRPTELGFLLKQEEWQEDLVVLARYALSRSLAAPNGFLREARTKRKATLEMSIQEAGRKVKGCHWVYEAAKQAKPDVVEILATFPAIREGDIPALIDATAKAMVIDRNGAAHGIDERAAARKMFNLLGIESADELTEEMYPEGSYDPDRTKEVAPPIEAPPPTDSKPAVEAEEVRAALRRVESVLVLQESKCQTRAG